MPFTFSPTKIEGVVVIESKKFSDSRGYFMEAYKKSDFREHGIPTDFPQDNYSFSLKGVIRGLHYQKAGFSQGKLVKAISGRIYDVALDIRPESKTFGNWVGETLSPLNGKMLWIPAGFAHGFQAMEDSAVHYKATTEYAPNSEGGIIWNDPELDIKWPIKKPILSEKDTQWPTLSEVRGSIE